MSKSRHITSDEAATKIQACIRGWQVRRNLVHDVRKAFEAIVTELDHSVYHHEVVWPSDLLCRPCVLGPQSSHDPPLLKRKQDSAAAAKKQRLLEELAWANQALARRKQQLRSVPST
eukprot:GILI01035887.1.p1 GENE.GILI01035887.1~~GILI01035887.1.p1  ORF type:complete len:117 (-),score=17.10 GILI01035887.1:501-851(-)